MLAWAWPQNYVASVELLIDPLESRTVAQGNEPGADAAQAIVASQMRVLTSGTVLSEAVDRLNLATDPEFNGGGGALSFLSESLRAITAGDNAPSAVERRRIAAVENLGRALDVSRSGSSFSMTLHAASESAEKSALIANTVAEVFLQQSGQIPSDQAGRRAEDINSRLSELREGVATAEKAVADYKAENELIDAQGRLITDDEILRLNEQLAEARARTIELNASAASSRGADIDSIVTGSLPEQVSSPVLSELRSRYAALNQQAERQATRLGPRHPERAATAAELESLRGAIDAELRRIADSLQVQLKRAVQNEQELAARLAGLKVRQGDIAPDLAELRELEREAAAQRAVYEEFLAAARENGGRSGLGLANASVISQARPPLEASGPSAATLAFGGAALGLLAGLGIAAAGGAAPAREEADEEAEAGQGEDPGVPADSGDPLGLKDAGRHDHDRTTERMGAPTEEQEKMYLHDPRYFDPNAQHGYPQQAPAPGPVHYPQPQAAAYPAMPAPYPAYTPEPPFHGAAQWAPAAVPYAQYPYPVQGPAAYAPPPHYAAPQVYYPAPYPPPAPAQYQHSPYVQPQPPMRQTAPQAPAEDRIDPRTEAAIDEIRASLREFRDAIQEFAQGYERPRRYGS